MSGSRTSFPLLLVGLLVCLAFRSSVDVDGGSYVCDARMKQEVYVVGSVFHEWLPSRSFLDGWGARAHPGFAHRALERRFPLQVGR